MLKISEWEEGMVLGLITRDILQENINLYAEASRDFNPIHIDQDFARQTPLGGTIAHGMLIMAYVSHLMTMTFGRVWLTGGRLDIRFKSPARPGDTVTVSGKVRQIERNGSRVVIKCEVLCQNQKGESIVSGEAVLKTEEP